MVTKWLSIKLADIPAVLVQLPSLMTSSTIAGIEAARTLLAIAGFEFLISLNLWSEVALGRPEIRSPQIPLFCHESQDFSPFPALVVFETTTAVAADSPPFRS